jgi:hypothetical protein
MRFAPKIAVLLAGLAGTGVAYAQSNALPDGQAMDINGVQTVCTGVTSDTRMNPEWKNYSLRLEFAGRDGQYLGDESVNVSGSGENLSVHCGGPWVLMMLPPGTYHVATDVTNAGHKDVTVHVPGHVVVRFPNAGGSEGPSGEVASE